MNTTPNINLTKERLVELINLASADSDGSKSSPDGTLSCSPSKLDRLLKVWYETKPNTYSFIYLNHPKAVTNVEWRRTGRFTPRGSVANVLMTSCEDNRTRIWVQTLLPDLVNFKLLPHFHLAATIEDDGSPKLVTHWVNNKEIQITKSLESLLQDMLSRVLNENDQASSSATPTTDDLDLDVGNDDTLMTESSKKLRHKLCRKINKQRALAASGRGKITTNQLHQPSKPVPPPVPPPPKFNQNPNQNDQSQVSDSNGTSNDQQNAATSSNTGRSTLTSLAEEFDKTLDSLLKDWRESTDLIFSINKTDGTLNSWQIRHLDGDETGSYRQVQVEKHSSLKNALPIHDATTMSNVTAYSPNFGTDQQNVFIVTHHMSGIVCLWKLNLEQGIEPVTRITGLPISPEWLQDGILIVEFDSNETVLRTSWVPDSDKPMDITEAEPFSTEKDYYRASRLANSMKILPQYHLNQLVELLAFGRIQRVKAILNHLVTCLTPSGNVPFENTRKAHRSRTLSIANQSSISLQNSLDFDDPISPIEQAPVEDIELDYVEVTAIKPLTLYSMLEADTEKPSTGDGKLHHAHEEFSSSFDSMMLSSRFQVEETLDEILGKSTLETISKQKAELKKLASEEQGKAPLTNFNPKKAKLLTNILTHTHLPGLTKNDQMHLLAIADAVASFDASPDDIRDMHDEEVNDHGIGGGGTGGGLSIVSTNIAIDSLDDRGLRFLTSMRQYVYLTKCLPLNQRGELRSAGIGIGNFVWAFHSETQDELIGLIPCVQRNKPEWSELREFGVGWWVKKLEVLRKLIEKVAQSAYQAKQDPLDAALFYLAMKKKTLVCALLRRTNCDKRLLKLFEQDFNDPVNRKKALKNAYALLGLHRFEHAAAFFLLAGSIWDAVEVCINNLNDIQLAMTLIRLHDSDSGLPENLKKLLLTEILGNKTADPFLRSMAYWKLGDYNSAVRTLLDGETNASILIFYRFLKDQPLVVKHRSQLSEFEQQQENEQQVKSETLHYLATAKSYLKTGCPLLALEVLDDLNGDQANRIRFVACLYILLNELDTLASNNPRGDVNASDLGLGSLAESATGIVGGREGSTHAFSEWFQKNVEALGKICVYSGQEEPLLRTMLTYCSVKLATEETLHTIRVEVVERLKNLGRGELKSDTSAGAQSDSS